MPQSSTSSTTWAAMRGTHPDSGLLWTARGQQHAHKPAPQADSFPALGRRRSFSAPDLADAATSNTNSSTHQQQPYSSAVAGSSSRSAGNSRSSSVERRSRHSNQQQVYQQKLVDNDSNNQQQAASTAGLALLQECHPWCDVVLLQEVLVSVDGDVAAALDALEHMLPADGTSNRQQQQPGGSQGTSSSKTNTKTRPSGAAAAADSSAALQLWPAGPDEESGAAEETQVAQQLGQLHLQQQHSQTQQQQQQRHQQQQHSQTQQQQQQQRHQQQQHSQTQQQQRHQQQQARLSVHPQQQQQQQQSAGQDTYHALRGDAVKLSHKYAKASKRAAAARARGDFSAAAQLSSEAVALKAAADAAHAAAALKIEVANNAGNADGLWELDLHGLHVGEALTALQERVELLQDLAGDLRKQQQMYAAQQQGGVGGSSTVAGDTRRAVLTSLCLPDGRLLSWEQQLAAMRQELRVIVGKGSHSRGGEASLPRVVEQWLLQHGFRHTWRGGCIGVQLKLL